MPLKIVAIVLGAAVLASHPANAGTVPTCWEYGAAAGVFDWQQAPSTACRDGKTVTGEAVVAPAGIPPAPSSDDRPGASPDPAGETIFSFSGVARFGLAALF